MNHHSFLRSTVFVALLVLPAVASLAGTGTRNFEKAFAAPELTGVVNHFTLRPSAMTSNDALPEQSAPESGIYMIRQRLNSQFLDAHVIESRDFAVVTRLSQNNDTQRWIVTNITGTTYMIQQLQSGRFLDAHDTPDKDFGVVTRPRQPNATQRWIFESVGNNVFRIQQEHTRRFLDAHESLDKDFRVVLRPHQPNTSQQWVLNRVPTT